MNTLRFYFDHSLAGHFYRRAKQRWVRRFCRPPQIICQGVTLEIVSLPSEMQDIICGGGYELAEVSLVPGFITNEDKVLEIGGAIGFISLYCRKVIGVKEMVSVEPNPRTLSYLRRNYELNGLTPALIQAAVADVDGPVHFHTSEMFWGDSLDVKSDDASADFITVEGKTFASLIKHAGIQFNALIIDIEGAEQHLKLDLLPDCVNKVLIELHPQLIGTRKAYGVLETLIRSGFCIQNQMHSVWALKRDV